MPAKETLITWLRNIGIVIGILITVLGGGGTAVQLMRAEPGTFSAADSVEVAEWSLTGIVVSLGSAAMGWIVRKFVDWKASRKPTPLADYIAVCGSLATVEAYVVGRPADLAAIESLRKSCAQVVGERTRTITPVTVPPAV